MSIDTTGLSDQLTAALDSSRSPLEPVTLRGFGVAELWSPDGDLLQSVEFDNLITQVGEQMYGERGAGLGGAPAAPTGMALGTGTTAVAKTGAGAALVTGVAASAVAVGTPTSTIPGTVRRITYVTTWGAGVATANAIAEVVLQNAGATTVPTNAVATSIIARALLSPVINKGAADSLTITWNHDIGTG